MSSSSDLDDCYHCVARTIAYIAVSSFTGENRAHHWIIAQTRIHLKHKNLWVQLFLASPMDDKGFRFVEDSRRGPNRGTG
jgi:hypothetical protein